MASAENVAFLDSTETVIVAWSLAPIVDKTTYPNIGTVLTDDARYKSFYDSFPAMQAAMPAPSGS
ncbi:hypothetical protein LMG28688_00840 [Paraburkholderia caffeinitolerans]|uniref:Uncharacterized protein n=1 Tax=Paraburkholderia caffeinitolerans TaxID=1723730 RepID=A0A6J5FK65_9BURK|nr:hypothetical protein [Paraburkholderia caffeinitolerans]CAB3779431.1 hypothetical protein LMG28688_00840 [Paraburkholderia caffeinitolerans]